MRLTVFGPGYPFRGGIANATTALVRALRGRGCEVEFLTPRRQYPGWLYPGGNDRDPEACEELEGSRAVLDPMNPLSWPRSRKLALASQADAWVIPYWTWAWAGLWHHLLGSRNRPPAVAVVHNPADHDGGRLQRGAARLVLARCDGLFTHAERLARHLGRTYPETPRGWHPLAGGPPVSLPDKNEARSELGLSPGVTVALFLGLIRPYKGVDLLLDACARLPASTDLHLVIAGEAWGTLGEELQEKVVRLGLEERVQLHLRWIPEVELPGFLAVADVMVLPYRSGSQSAVAPLALSQGIPVLATDVGGVPEVVRDGVNGLIVPPGSVEALGEALLRLERGALEELGRGARAGAGDLSWDGYAGALVDLIGEIDSRRR